MLSGCLAGCCMGQSEWCDVCKTLPRCRCVQLAKESSRLRTQREIEADEAATRLQRELALSTVMRQRRLRTLEEDLARRTAAETEELRRYEEAVQAQEVRPKSLFSGSPCTCTLSFHLFHFQCLVFSPYSVCYRSAVC
jgi:hypothetical protein